MTTGGGTPRGNITDEVTVHIQASIDDVWEALTAPELRKQWFFGAETETDWQVGSPIIHRSRLQGRAYQDKGSIIAFDPPTLLSHTHWSAFSGLPDRPENYERITYALAERGGGTEVTVTEVNLPSPEAGSISRRNWLVALGKLKRLTEKDRQRLVGGWML